MRICDLLASDQNGKQEVIGQIAWDGKKLHLSDGLNPDMVLGTCGSDERVNGHDNPGEWFEQLPSIFSGSRLRAKMRGEKESDMITDNDRAARLHVALDRVLDSHGAVAVARDAGNRSNVARKAWETRHETGGTKKFDPKEGRPAPAMTTRHLKPFGWAYKPEKKTELQFEKEEAARMAKPPVEPV